MLFGLILKEKRFMILTVIISALTVLAMTSVVLSKPYVKVKKLNIGLYWVVCLIGNLAYCYLPYRLKECLGWNYCKHFG